MLCSLSIAIPMAIEKDYRATVKERYIWLFRQGKAMLFNQRDKCR